MPPKQINTSFLGKFFGAYTKIEYDENQLHLYKKTKEKETYHWNAIAGYTLQKNSIFGTTLEFILETTKLKINLLKHSQCNDNIDIINRLITPIIHQKIERKKSLYKKHTQEE